MRPYKGSNKKTAKQKYQREHTHKTEQNKTKICK